jgi:hypothetical protein
MSQQVVSEILVIVVAVLFSFAAGGATIAALLVMTLNSVFKSPVLLGAMEKLFSALSPEWQEVLKAALAVGDEVTDGIPVTEKPVASGAMARVEG